MQASTTSNTGDNTGSNTGSNRESATKFPHDLYRMLASVNDLNLQHIISWQDDGASLVIQNKRQFEDQVMPM